MKYFPALLLCLAGCAEPTPEQREAWRQQDIRKQNLLNKFYNQKLIRINEGFSEVVFEFEDGSKIKAWSNKAVRMDYYPR